MLRGKIRGKLLEHAKNGGHEGFSPINGEKISFTATGGIAKIALPQTIRSDTMKRVRDSGCMLRSIKAGVQRTEVFQDEGGRKKQRLSLLHFDHTEKIVEEGLMTINGALHSDTHSDTIYDTLQGGIATEPLCLNSLSDKLNRKHSLGRISFGEVSLNTLISKLSSRRSGDYSQGLKVEMRATEKSVTLLCSNQLAIRRVNENDFLMEGAPGALFTDARDIVYSNFSYM